MRKTTAKLDNGCLQLVLNLPGVPGGYCGTRFAWAGIIAEVTAGGHHLFGPWRPEPYPPDEHDNVTGTAGEFGMGYGGMPTPPGFDEAAPGGEFVKIGVGVLRRPDAGPYQFWRRYEIVTAPRWTVKAGKTRATLRQQLDHAAAGYDYTYELELEPGRAAFVTRHTLANTGARAIRQTHYSHNFIVIDRQPIGPDYEVIFPFTLENVFEAGAPVALAGPALSFREPLRQPVFGVLRGFGDTPAANAVTVRHRPSGFAVRMTGDRPVARYHFWAAPGAACPEPFVALDLAPGQAATWQHRYELG